MSDGPTPPHRSVGSLQDRFALFQPALGVSWSHSVSCRIMVVKHEANVTVQSAAGEDETSALREMRLCFSPSTAPATCFYVVQSDAIRGVQLSA